MARPVTLCTLQWGDLPLDVICEKAKSFGFDGVELGLPSHLDVRQNCFVFRIIWSARRYVIISINGINPYCLIISGAMAILMECTCGRSKI